MVADGGNHPTPPADVPIEAYDRALLINQDVRSTTQSIRSSCSSKPPYLLLRLSSTQVMARIDVI